MLLRLLRFSSSSTEKTNLAHTHRHLSSSFLSMMMTVVMIAQSFNFAGRFFAKISSVTELFPKFDKSFGHFSPPIKVGDRRPASIQTSRVIRTASFDAPLALRCFRNPDTSGLATIAPKIPVVSDCNREKLTALPHSHELPRFGHRFGHRARFVANFHRDTKFSSPSIRGSLPSWCPNPLWKKRPPQRREIPPSIEEREWESESSTAAAAAGLDL